MYEKCPFEFFERFWVAGKKALVASRIVHYVTRGKSSTFFLRMGLLPERLSWVKLEVCAKILYSFKQPLFSWVDYKINNIIKIKKNYLRPENFTIAPKLDLREIYVTFAPIFGGRYGRVRNKILFFLTGCAKFDFANPNECAK